MKRILLFNRRMIKDLHRFHVLIGTVTIFVLGFALIRGGMIFTVGEDGEIWEGYLCMGIVVYMGIGWLVDKMVRFISHRRASQVKTLDSPYQQPPMSASPRKPF